uniref:Uncharacterized protein n=1 Tax=Neisseria lactamica TaxID=486 RepID=Q8GGA3_NEILA|nr:hypothetical protein [Neisseria lactamica]
MVRAVRRRSATAYCPEGWAGKTCGKISAEFRQMNGCFLKICADGRLVILSPSGCEPYGFAGKT